MFKYQMDAATHISLLAMKDAPQLYNLIDRNRDHIGAWLKFPNMTLTEEDSSTFIKRTRIRYAQDDGYWLESGVETSLLALLDTYTLIKKTRRPK